ncbi:MAG: SPFH domain-containing protein [Bacteroidales bacterium]|nr:SPFH domain-containing protein [Bacteroidales bacterium]
MDTKEKVIKMTALNSGFLQLVVNIALLAVTVMVIVNGGNEPGWQVIVGDVVLWILWGLHVMGFKTMVVQPNHARVLTFFGRYVGTVRENGFFWVNPFYARRRVSLRASNMDVEPIKVNDKSGNPIMIGLVLVWRVEDTYRVSFDIESESSLYDFVAVQSDSALRKVASQYNYDNLDDLEEVTLRNGGDEVNLRLEAEIRRHLEIAGVEVVEARINYLAYAQEIASAMLKRQQAEAVIAAREKLVEGAVSMVDMALKKLAADNVVQLDEERKAAMVSNLLVVLCGDEGVSPVMNTGSIY